MKKQITSGNNNSIFFMKYFFDKNIDLKIEIIYNPPHQETSEVLRKKKMIHDNAKPEIKFVRIFALEK
jgi:hypothetical protein